MNISYYELSYVKEAMNFLQLNDSFLLSIIKAKNKYFINPIHLLEYYNLLKISEYDSHCLFLNQTTYLCLCYFEYDKYFSTLTYLMNYK